MQASSWRYVVSLERCGEGENAENVWNLRELYTETTGALSWSKQPVWAQGETWSELVDDHRRMGAALTADEILDLTLDPPGLRARDPLCPGTDGDLS